MSACRCWGQTVASSCCCVGRPPYQSGQRSTSPSTRRSGRRGSAQTSFHPCHRTSTRPTTSRPRPSRISGGRCRSHSIERIASMFRKPTGTVCRFPRRPEQRPASSRPRFGCLLLPKHSRHCQCKPGQNFSTAEHIPGNEQVNIFAGLVDLHNALLRIDQPDHATAMLHIIRSLIAHRHVRIVGGFDFYCQMRHAWHGLTTHGWLVGELYRHVREAIVVEVTFWTV